MDKNLIKHYKASIKSILINSTFPSSILIMLVIIAIQFYTFKSYNADAILIIIDVIIFSLALIIFLILFTKRIYQYTFVNVYQDHLEISDVSQIHARLTGIKFSEIKSVSIEKKTLIIEVNEKIKVLHIKDEQELKELIENKIKT